MENGFLQAFVEGRLQMWQPPQEYEGETVPGRWVTIESLRIQFPAESQLRIKTKLRRAAVDADARERRPCLVGSNESRNLQPGTLLYFDDDPASDRPFHVRLDVGSFDWFPNCFIEEEMSDLDPPSAQVEANGECEMQACLA